MESESYVVVNLMVTVMTTLILNLQINPMVNLLVNFMANLVADLMAYLMDEFYCSCRIHIYIYISSNEPLRQPSKYSLNFSQIKLTFQQITS